MLHLRVFSTALVLSLLAGPLGLTGASSLPAACVEAPLSEAAARLLHPGAEVVDVREQADFVTALALVPLVAPGTRHHLVQAGAAWCDAQAGFNDAWRLAGRPHDAVAMAEAFATLAPAPFFADVTVTQARAIPGGAAVTTHARTNGVVAEWVVLVDAQGVRSAEWVATGFAVAPFEAEVEGLTALPGAAWRIVRAPDGRLVDETPLESLAFLVPLPSLSTRAVLPDGFLLYVHTVGQDGGPVGGGHMTGVGPNVGSDTGVGRADFHRLTLAVAVENYEEYLSWGLQKGWRTNEGHIYIDDAITAYCIACVWVNQYFQVHVSSQVLLALEALGYTYPAGRERDAYSNVLGHEMFHNFQNAYSKPGSTSMGGYYSEGIARMQETLHAYSDVSAKDDTLVTAADANGCNGYYTSGTSNRTVAMALGPTNRSYAACRFWMDFYQEHGWNGILGVLQQSPHERAKPSYLEFRGLVENVTGAPIEEALLDFAVNVLTHEPLVWGPVTGGPAIDWTAYITPLRADVLHLGHATGDIKLVDGGMVARELKVGGIVKSRVSALSPDDEHTLHLVRAGPGGVTTTPLASGTTVAAPAAGERVWVVALRADPGVTVLRLRLE